MKIRLTIDLPISEACGAFKGEVFTVIGEKLKQGDTYLTYFKGKNGDKCGAYFYEYEVVE